MRRRLFAAVSAVSLVLFAGTVGFWMRSWQLGDELRYYREPHDLEVESNRGLVCIAWGQLVSRDYPPPSGWNGSFWPFQRRVEFIDVDTRRGTTLGFAAARWGWQRPNDTGDGWSVTFPWWLPASGLGVLPLAYGMTYWKRRRERTKGHCPRCGYNLLGNTSGVCPECGTPVPKEAVDGSPRPA